MGIANFSFQVLCLLLPVLCVIRIGLLFLQSTTSHVARQVARKCSHRPLEFRVCCRVKMCQETLYVRLDYRVLLFLLRLRGHVADMGAHAGLCIEGRYGHGMNLVWR